MMPEKKSWWQKVSRLVLRISGWNLVENLPAEPKYILIGFPHTSNWDWVVGLFMMASFGLRPRWIGKDTLFRGIAGPVMRWFGGIPVLRGAKKNFVGQIVDIYNESKSLVIALAPEGTRKYVDHWKTGFYYIARGAQIPIAMAFLDYSKKICGVGEHFMPSGDIQTDMQIIEKLYAGVLGKFPENQGLVRFEI